MSQLHERNLKHLIVRQHMQLADGDGDRQLDFPTNHGEVFKYTKC